METMVRPFMRGPWWPPYQREQCYDAWFSVFGKICNAVVVIDLPEWWVENPHHSMMFTDVEWKEWREEAIRIVSEYRNRTADIRMLGEVPW